MAHEDYLCCRICHRALAYAKGNGMMKEYTCEECLEKLIEIGKPELAIKKRFIEWVENEDIKTICEILKTISYQVCFYNNAYDNALVKKIGDKIFALEGE